MPRKLEPAFKALPDAPGFWLDAWLTNYGCPVVMGPDGLMALGWGEEPTHADSLRADRHEDAYGNPQAGGWYGPLPVPAKRRYEIRKLKKEFNHHLCAVQLGLALPK